MVSRESSLELQKTQEGSQNQEKQQEAIASLIVGENWPKKTSEASSAGVGDHNWADVSKEGDPDGKPANWNKPAWAERDMSQGEGMDNFPANFSTVSGVISELSAAGRQDNQMPKRPTYVSNAGR